MNQDEHSLTDISSCACSTDKTIARNPEVLYLLIKQVYPRTLVCKTHQMLHTQFQVILSLILKNNTQLPYGKTQKADNRSTVMAFVFCFCPRKKTASVKS